MNPITPFVFIITLAFVIIYAHWCDNHPSKTNLLGVAIWLIVFGIMCSSALAILFSIRH